ncbi:histidinol-phosphate/aromatic aminotransferase/cobyric acid decarboxylase-like protein [Arthrobacter sp. B3I4]|nr:histidinol-phosphate/aromatic aminotransferase/cobyric acid decarboxylase-like protein [Arthrobacter sp. B3I4]
MVVDEAYVECAEAGSGPDSLALYRRGYAVAAPAIAEEPRRTALPFSVSALAQKAAIASLDAGDEVNRGWQPSSRSAHRWPRSWKRRAGNCIQAKATSCGSVPMTPSGDAGGRV